MDGSQDRVKKPWGHYADIFRSDEVVFMRIVISTGDASYIEKAKK